MTGVPRIPTILAWCALAVAVTVPIAVAATSPLLAWRSPVYIAAGLAGVAGLCLILVQPLLIGGYVPTLSQTRRRRLHRIIGGLLVLMVIVHVVGLWVTSPPDVVDALLFTSATSFSAWGVVAMWAVFLAATLALIRKRWPWRLRSWRLAHTAAVVVVVVGTVVHAMQIQGTMGTLSKTLLCGLVLIVVVKVLTDLRAWKSGLRRDRG